MKHSVREILDKPYTRILIRNEDGSYTAQILEFPGCVAEGDTPDEAMSDLDKAASSWIEVAVKQNEAVPEPLTSYGYSGKINLRLPKSIHKQAARFAKRDDVSLNQFFASAIAARVGSEDMCERLANRIEERLERLQRCSGSFFHIQHMCEIRVTSNENAQVFSCNAERFIPAQCSDTAPLVASTKDALTEWTNQVKYPERAITNG